MDGQLDDKDIEQLAGEHSTRLDFWAAFLNRTGVGAMAELGVWEGDYARAMLERCPGIERYFLIDPWRQLPSWNKPFNLSDSHFAGVLAKAKAAVAGAGEKAIFLRGTTTEVIDEIADGSLDFVYIDGDHTLRGVSIDLICAWSKLRVGGWLGGDDLTPSIWQHGGRYEPSLVFPFAIHFAEAMGASIYTLPGSQFVMVKRPGRNFRFIDLAGGYGDTSLNAHLALPTILRNRLRRRG